MANHAWMVGDDYSIVDMALLGWARIAPRVLGQETYDSFANVKRWLETINVCPAVAKVDALMQRFKFQIEIDEEARKHMFPGPYHHKGYEASS